MRMVVATRRVVRFALLVAVVGGLGIGLVLSFLAAPAHSTSARSAAGSAHPRWEPVRPAPRAGPNIRMSTATPGFAGAVAQCNPSDMSLSLDQTANVGMNAEASALELTNTSADPCDLVGYPAVTLVLEDGSMEPATQTSVEMPGIYGDGFEASSATSPIVVNPGAVAVVYVFTFTDTNSGFCPEAVEQPEVTFEGWAHGLLLSGGGLPTCLGNPLAVSPVGLEGSSLWPTTQSMIPPSNFVLPAVTS